MDRLIKATALATSVALLFTTLATSGFCAGSDATGGGAAKKAEAVRTIVGRGESGWAVVDIRSVTGTVVVVSEALGREVDLEESIRYSLFNGRNESNRSVELPLLNAAVPGFRQAVFVKRDDGRYAARVEFTAGRNVEYRQIPLRGVDDLLLLREYVEHFGEIEKGSYRMERKPRLSRDEAFPKETDEAITFEMRTPRYVLATRTDGRVFLKDGSEVAGEVLPVFDEGQILVQAGIDTRRIAVSAIDRLRFQGNRSSTAVSRAVMMGIGSAATGALSGALAAWQSDSDVSDFVLFGTVVFGVAGFFVGLLTGAGEGKSSSDITLGKVEAGDDEGEPKDEEVERPQR